MVQDAAFQNELLKEKIYIIGSMGNYETSQHWLLAAPTRIEPKIRVKFSYESLNW